MKILILLFIIVVMYMIFSIKIVPKKKIFIIEKYENKKILKSGIYFINPFTSKIVKKMKTGLMLTTLNEELLLTKDLKTQIFNFNIYYDIENPLLCCNNYEHIIEYVEKDFRNAIRDEFDRFDLSDSTSETHLNAVNNAIFNANLYLQSFGVKINSVMQEFLGDFDCVKNQAQHNIEKKINY